MKSNEYGTSARKKRKAMYSSEDMDVPEDVHGTELPETDGTAERQHTLPDILRRDNRSDTAIDEL